MACRAALSTAALRLAEGCGPMAVVIDPRNAVDTVVATESGTSMPCWASKCTQPSPKRRVQTTHPGDVVCHASHLRASVNTATRHDSVGVRGASRARAAPDRLTWAAILVQ